MTIKNLTSIIIVGVALAFSMGVKAQLHVDPSGNLGVGTTQPEGAFHVSRPGTVLSYMESSDNGAVQLRFKSNSGNRRFLAVDENNIPETQMVFGNTEIQFAGRTNVGDGIWATLNPTGLYVSGNIQTTASGVVHADYVFENNFNLPSIKQHAEQMWQNKHLPAVGPGIHDDNGSAIINVGEKTMGILEELEIAHIYIEKLHSNLALLENQLNTKLALMEARISGLEN